MCKILDELKETNRILDWEYTNDRIVYFDDQNQKHNYLFDFKIKTKSNKTIYIETKGYVKPLDLIKWKAAKDQNFVLIKFFQKNLQQVENKILRLKS